MSQQRYEHAPRSSEKEKSLLATVMKASSIHEETSRLLNLETTHHLAAERDFTQCQILLLSTL